VLAFKPPYFDGDKYFYDYERDEQMYDENPFYSE